MSEQLYIHRGCGQSLPEALSLLARTLRDSDAAVALLYTPHECLVARFTPDSGLTRPVAGKMQSVSLNSTYEARVFHERAELRWLNDPRSARAHRTVILSDTALDLGLTQTALSPLATLDQAYVLWGRGYAGGGQLPAGWSRLAEARVGSLDIPWPDVREGQYVQLHVREYLGAFADGNVAVAEERLLKLEAGPCPKEL